MRRGPRQCTWTIVCTECVDSPCMETESSVFLVMDGSLFSLRACFSFTVYRLIRDTMSTDLVYGRVLTSESNRT